MRAETCWNSENDRFVSQFFVSGSVGLGRFFLAKEAQIRFNNLRGEYSKIRREQKNKLPGTKAKRAKRWSFFICLKPNCLGYARHNLSYIQENKRDEIDQQILKLMKAEASLIISQKERTFSGNVCISREVYRPSSSPIRTEISDPDPSEYQADRVQSATPPGRTLSGSRILGDDEHFEGHEPSFLQPLNVSACQFRFQKAETESRMKTWSCRCLYSVLFMVSLCNLMVNVFIKILCDVDFTKNAAETEKIDKFFGQMPDAKTNMWIAVWIWLWHLALASGSGSGIWSRVNWP